MDLPENIKLIDFHSRSNWKHLASHNIIENFDLINGPGMYTFAMGSQENFLNFHSILDKKRYTTVGPFKSKKELLSFQAQHSTKGTLYAGMLLNLKNCLLNGPKIIKVKNQAQLDEFLSVFPRKDTKDLVSKKLNNKNFSFFYQKKADIPVCRALIYQGSPRVVSLTLVVTHSNYLRQGIAYNFLLGVFNHLKAHNVKTIVLQSTQSGVPLYQKLGFQTLSHYLEIELMPKISAKP